MTTDIKDLFKDLSAKEQDVIVLMFGLTGDNRCRPAEEIGAMYGVDKDTILQIAQQALAKLPVSAEELKAIGEKAAEELKNKIAQSKPRRVLSDLDSELLNINFFETPEK